MLTAPELIVLLPLDRAMWYPAIRLEPGWERIIHLHIR
jgi:hypothetical protein